MTTTQLLVSLWEPGWVVPTVSLLALLAYAVRFGARAGGAKVVCFAFAVAIFFLSLASPVGVLARGYLFSAHMLQHLLLMLAVPPLLLLGLPRVVASPPWAPRDPDSPLTTFGSWAFGIAAMWIWHAPTLCNAAAASVGVQAFQTVSLLAMGLAFWRPVFAPDLSERLPVFPATLYLFSACIGCTILGVVVTLSPVAVCAAYMHPVDSLGVLPLLRNGWGLSCKADQEIGGLLMWVPACLVYASAILATFGRYYAEEGRAPLARLERATKGGGT